MKTFYSDYVQHCMRFFARYTRPKFRSNADKENWNACASAIKGFTDFEQDILLNVYSEGDTIPDNIYRISEDRSIKQETIWKIVNTLERRIAKRRGLL